MHGRHLRLFRSRQAGRDRNQKPRMAPRHLVASVYRDYFMRVHVALSVHDRPSKHAAADRSSRSMQVVVGEPYDSQSCRG
jgi:hypothetical protein